MNGTLAINFDLALEGMQEWQSPAYRERLQGELRKRSPAHAEFWMQWGELLWDEEAKFLRVTCTVVKGDELSVLEDFATAELSRAARRVLPGREPTVRLLTVSVVGPPRRSEFSDQERWGWYAVALLLEASWIRDDPEAAPRISDHVTKLRRFRKAAFGWNQTDGVGMLSVEVMARSAAAADGEARDALVNLSWAEVKDPGDLPITTLKVEWLSES